MAPAKKPVVCKQCDVEMNPHAEKLLDPRTPEEAAQADPALGGILEEFHSCPACGCGAARRA